MGASDLFIHTIRFMPSAKQGRYEYNFEQKMRVLILLSMCIFKLSTPCFLQILYHQSTFRKKSFKSYDITRERNCSRDF